MVKCIIIAHNNTNQNTSHFYLMFGPHNSLYLKKFEIEEIKSVQKNWAQKQVGTTSRCWNPKMKTVLESGCKKNLQKQPVHVITSHIGHIKLA